MYKITSDYEKKKLMKIKKLCVNDYKLSMDHLK